MTVALLYVAFIVGIGFAGAVFHELADRTTGETAGQFMLKVTYRTFSWFWLGVAGILLSVAIRLPW